MAMSSSLEVGSWITHHHFTPEQIYNRRIISNHSKLFLYHYFYPFVHFPGKGLRPMRMIMISFIAHSSFRDPWFLTSRPVPPPCHTLWRRLRDRNSLSREVQHMSVQIGEPCTGLSKIHVGNVWGKDF